MDNPPISTKTLTHIADQIQEALDVHQSITFTFTPNIGGSRAWFKYIIDYYLKLNHKIIIVDPIECLDNSNNAFLYLLLKKLTPVCPKYDQLSLENTLDLIKAELEKNSTEEIVIFLLGLGSFPNLNPILGNLLFSLWQPRKQNLHFVSTFSAIWTPLDFTDQFGKFAETLTENLIKIDPLSEADIDQVITHWETKLNKSLTKTERKAIHKYSQGSAEVAKSLVHRLIRQYKDLNQICESLSKSSNAKDNFTFANGQLMFGEANTLETFSAQEVRVLKTFVTKAPNLVTRDELAAAMWPDDSYDKYSDWAIDQIISNIRQKLITLSASIRIKTVKGEGYMLLN